MRAFQDLLIYAEDTHVEKEGSIILLERFENQGKARQVFPIHSVPKFLEGKALPGDQAIVHFNVVTYDFADGKKLVSKYFIKDDIYHVPENMVHGVISADGNIEMLDESHLIVPIKKPESKTESGIIWELNNNKAKLKQEIMYGYVKVSNTIPAGSKVVLSTYSDYEIDIPGHDKMWLVRDSSIVAIDEE